MKSITNSNEINLYAVLKLILRNKVKLILIIIIGVALTLIHNNIFKKVYTPVYEISINFDRIGLREEAKYSLLNNYLNSHQPDYLNQVLLSAITTGIGGKLNFDENLINLYISQITPEKDKLGTIDKFESEWALKIFLNFLKENMIYSTLKKEVIKDYIKDYIIEYELQKNNSDSESSHIKPIKIKIISEVGEIEIWDKFFQKQYNEVNENVRVYVLEKINNYIMNLKINNNYLVENLELVDQLKPQIINLSNDLLEKYSENLTNVVNLSPLNDANNFNAAIMIKPLNIKIINEVQKGTKIQTKILISIILSLVLGIIYLIILDSIKNSKKYDE